MTKVLLALGQFQFTVGKTSFERLARKSSYRWVQNERLGTYPAADFTGYEASTIELAGEAYAAMATGDDPLRVLKDEADRGQPLILIDAQGRAHGRWAVVSIAEDLAAYGADGVARRNAFRVSLMRVYDDAAADDARAI